MKRVSRILTGAALVPAALLALTACGGSSSNGGPAPVSGTAGPAGMTATTPAATTASPAPVATTASATRAAATTPAATGTTPASYEPIVNPRDGQGLDFGYVTHVRSGSTVTLTFDRATFVSDVNAPDGYKITDDSPKLRTFPLAPGAAVLMLDSPGGTTNLVRMTPKEFVADADQELKTQRIPVWLRHTGATTGPVTALTEQYLP